MRATGQLLPDEVSNTVAIYGQSQGGHATLWAAQLAPTYAPEMHVVGAAAMAPPTDLWVLLQHDAAEPQGIVLTALALTSWSTLYPQAKLSEIVHDTAVPFVDNLAQRCVDHRRRLRRRATRAQRVLSEPRDHPMLTLGVRRSCRVRSWEQSGFAGDEHLLGSVGG